MPFWVKNQDNLCPCQQFETLKMLQVVKGSDPFILPSEEKQKWEGNKNMVGFLPSWSWETHGGQVPVWQKKETEDAFAIYAVAW